MFSLLKKGVKKVLEIFNVKIVKIPALSNFEALMNEEEEFLEIYEKCESFTMTSKERMFTLYKSMKYVIDSEIPGDFVECGTWRGGSAMLMAYTLLKLGVTNRQIYLYDTFCGMTQPGEHDVRVANKKRAMDTWQIHQEDESES